MGKRLMDTLEDKERELFALLFLLDNQGYVYYDDDNDEDIASLEKYLSDQNIKFEKGQRNRKYLTVCV